ncbi:MAG: hypothetical protein ACRDVZ_15870 [Jiangellaceae bacterium]
MNTLWNEPMGGSVYAFSDALNGAAKCVEVRVVASATAPQTGAVRPQAVEILGTPRHVDQLKGGRFVRTWSPPV